MNYAAAAAKANNNGNGHNGNGNGAQQHQQAAQSSQSKATTVAAANPPPPAAAAAAASTSSAPAATAAPARAFIHTRDWTPPTGDTGNIIMMEPALAAAATIDFQKDIAGLKSGGATATAASAANNSTDAAEAAAASHAISTKLRSILDMHGFVIVENVLSPSEIQAFEQMWNGDLMSIIAPPKDAAQKAAMEKSAILNKIKEDPSRNWPMEKLPLGTKFASDRGLPHGRTAWAARSHPNVIKTFAALFGTTDLCTGVDNVFFDNRVVVNIPPGSANESMLWPHSDQNRFIEGGDQDCNQGVLYIWPADATSSATVVWPGSNKRVYDQLMASRDWSRSGHFCRLDKKQHSEFVKHARRVPVPAGGLLIWSSRTTHQGFSGGPRLAFPICLQPKQFRSVAARNGKIDLVRAGQPSSHWATLAVKHSLARPPTQLVCGEDASVRIEHSAHWQHFEGQDPLVPKRLPIPDAIMNML